MSFRSRASLSAVLLCLVACAEVRGPESQPGQEPDVEVRPTFGSEAEPRLCTVDPAGFGGWQAADGPREVLTHRLAATPGALFVLSPFALRRSNDAGQTFQVVESPPAGRYPGAMASLDDDIFIATDSGAIRSGDGGETWHGANAGLDGGVASFHPGRSSLLARSSSGSLLRWSVAEAAWKQVDSGSSYAPGVAASDGKTVLVDTGSGVLRSTDLADWSLVNGLEAWGYEDLLIADERGLAITAAGEIRRSADSGVNWLPAQQSTLEIGTATRVIQHGDAMFALTSKGVVRSADGGASWGIALSDSPALGVREIAASSSLLAVELGSISVTSDGGATWSEAASFIDSTPIAFGKVGSSLLTSTDAAGVFVSNGDGAFQPTNASGYFLRDVETSAGSSYLVFSQRQPTIPSYGMSWAARTNDGGASFQAVSLPPTHDVLGRAFETIAVVGDVILAGGVDAMSGASSGPGVWASTDGGDSWQPASDGLPEVGFGDAPLYPAVLSLVTRGDAVLALLDDHGVFETRDHGESWQRVGAPLPLDAAAAVDRLLVAGDALYLASSTASDPIWRFASGSWQQVAATGLPTSSRVTAFTAVGASVIAAVRGSGSSGVYLSNDQGETWQSLGLDRRVRALFVDGETLQVGVEGEGSFSIDVGSCR